jgi:membrane protein
VTGLTKASGDLVTKQVDPSFSSEEIRAQTGAVGLVVTVLSASSFARAVMRAYERVWELPPVGGIRAWRRSLGWLLGWLASLQLLAVMGWAGGRMQLTALGPVMTLLQAVLVALVWWWTLRVLLSHRVRWRSLLVPAGVTGVALTAYTAGSALVMPHYATSTTAQFGTFGLVLAVATWLVGFGGVLVVAAVGGRVLFEDPSTRRLAAQVWSGLVAARQTAPRAPGVGAPGRPGRRSHGGSGRRRDPADRPDLL